MNDDLARRMHQLPGDDKAQAIGEVKDVFWDGARRYSHTQLNRLGVMGLLDRLPVPLSVGLPGRGFEGEHH